MHGHRLVVLTGFEPFAGFAINPSWEVVRALNQRMIKSHRIQAVQIPLRYNTIKPSIENIVDEKQPTMLIGFGQSYRPSISLEKVALNFADLSSSDVSYNCGTRPEHELLEPCSPTAYFTKLPIRKILQNLRQKGIPAEISYSAGTFGCNQLFFHLMSKIARDKLKAKAGFIHVPSLPSQAMQLQKKRRLTIPSMNLQTLIQAAEIAVETTIDDLQP